MPAKEIWERASVWPLRMIFPDRSGYTLWASTDGGDMVLALKSYILLFRSKRALRNFVANDQSSNLAALSGYTLFQDAAADSVQAREALRTYRTFDFRVALDLQTSKAWDHWTIGECEEVLNCWNLLEDTSVTIGDRHMAEAPGSHPQVRRLLEILTFITPEQIGDLRGLESQSIHGMFVDILDAVMRKTLTIC